MKKKFTFLMAAFVLLTMMVLPWKAVGQTTYTFNSSIPTKGWSTSGGSQNINSKSWTYSSSTYIGAQATRIQIGSQNNPQTSAWTIQTNVSNFGDNIRITSIAITAYTTAASATYDISAGGSSVKSGSLTTSSNTYTASSLNVTSGSIVVTLTGSSTSKAMYLSNISVTYEDIPSGPVNLDAPVLGSTPTAGLNSVTVTWGAVSHATKYTLQYATNNSFTSPSEVENISNAATSYTVTSLDAENTYYFHLMAIGDGGTYYNNSGWSNTVSAQPLAYVTLSAPSNLAAEIGNEQVALTWDAVENATKYKVEYADNSSFTSSSEVESTTTSKTITGLTNGTTYYFKVKSIGNGTTYHDSDYGTTVNATPSNLVKITITQDNVSEFTNSYNWYTWASGGVSGKVYGYKNSGIQVSSANDKEPNCIYNTTAIPGIIKSIKMVKKSSATTRSWTPTLGNTTLTSPSSGTSLTEHIVDTDGYTWTVSEGSYSYFLLSVSGGATTITTIEIVYEPAPTYAVTITNPDNGEITVKKNGTAISSGNEVYEGASMTLTASPSSGYALRQWSVAETDGEHTVTVTNNAFTMPNYPITIGATFEVLRTVALAEGITGGTVTRSTEACLSGTEVTITANANSGYRFGSFTVTDADAGDVDVSTTENVGTFTMPAKNVTVNATFIQTHTVTYKANGGTGDDDVNTYDHGTDVTVKSNSFTAPDGKYFSTWNTQADGEGANYAIDAKISGIAADYNLFAKWLNRTYHVTFNVNGNTTAIAARDIVHDTPQALPTPTMAGFDFIGWATTPNGTTYVDKTSYNPSGNEENITLYAVFGSSESDNLTINVAATGFSSTGYNASGNFTVKGKQINYTQIGKQTSGTDSYLQFKASSGAVYNANNNSLGRITSIVITYYSGSNIGLSVKGGISANPTSGTSISSTHEENVYTFDFGSNKFDYFVINCGSSFSQVTSIVVYYETTASNTVIYDHVTKEANYEITTPTVIAKGAVLDMNGHTLTNTTAANLIIADGGQISVSNTGVQATFQKSVTGFGSATDNANNYKLIAKPTTGNMTLTAGEGMLANNYDLYYFDENKNGAEWRNYKVSPFTINNGQGYLYANSEDVILNFAGEVPTATTKSGIELSYTSGNNFAGFNLFGNPFAVNITSMKINTTPCGYFKLENDGTFTSVPNVALNPVAVGQGFMVEAEANTDKLHLNPVSKDEESFSNESFKEQSNTT